MKTEWIGPKIIIGNQATGDYYYPRKEIEKEIITEIEKGNHLLIAAPRRVGKTSIVVNIANNNCPKGTKCIFEDIQGIRSEKDFYKRLYELILSCLRRDKKIWNKLSNFFQKIDIDEISADGKIKFGDKKRLDYLAEIDKTANQLKSNDVKVVLFIDELPEVIHNLYKNNKTDEAKRILKNLREWRQNNQYSAIQLVLTGSVGMHHVVKRIEGRTIDLNNLKVIDFEPFMPEHAKHYIGHVTKNATVKYPYSLSKYLITKISYPIPYFINLILEEVNKKAKRNNTRIISEKDIDIAFDKVVKDSSYFKDWKHRLFDYFTLNEALFLNEILLFIAHKNKINKMELYDLARKHKKEIDYMEFIGNLETDGYILEKDNHYIFVSPFLKEFWKRDQPVYNG
ncbi:MAG: AAA-like domain-containing protein [Bacteroidota bacterium]|nr:AAA-like domain-containing protein [Bacteroidota bacterium]